MKKIKTICPRCGIGERQSQGWCRQCQNIYNKKHRDLGSQLRWKYGISLAEKHLMLWEQRFKCAACEQRIDKKSKVDHCHVTGVVRGILCSNCNLALGLMKEDPELIHKLAAYAERIKAKR